MAEKFPEGHQGEAVTIVMVLEHKVFGKAGGRKLLLSPGPVRRLFSKEELYALITSGDEPSPAAIKAIITHAVWEAVLFPRILR